jgi:hypothetical protein
MNTDKTEEELERVKIEEGYRNYLWRKEEVNKKLSELINNFKINFQNALKEKRSGELFVMQELNNIKPYRHYISDKISSLNNQSKSLRVQKALAEYEAYALYEHYLIWEHSFKIRQDYSYLKEEPTFFNDNVPTDFFIWNDKTQFIKNGIIDQLGIALKENKFINYSGSDFFNIFASKKPRQRVDWISKKAAKSEMLYLIYILLERFQILQKEDNDMKYEKMANCFTINGAKIISASKLRFRFNQIANGDPVKRSKKLDEICESLLQKK